ncbi:MAG TPA: chromate transporter, partial [Bacilli bacterium]|nr:chromate transporter [Bacilli bacterium]
MIYLLLFLEFLKIGLFSFGGGYGMISMMKETVLANNWLSEAQLLDFIGIAESTPGPIAINMATFIGTSQGGMLGGAIATIGVILP